MRFPLRSKDARFAVSADFDRADELLAVVDGQLTRARRGHDRFPSRDNMFQ
jgi:hypothetical protein